ncbi:hypothetical protein [Pseudonocardia asaccharolytica]|uniref:hypothetical protein n=1 Tax=Pseudonocardia asaccharolytica TaxID=54010 RepID=UPI00041C3A9E|nr:hypothetical protein [Pseudonocardia asaccharolytica]
MPGHRGGLWHDAAAPGPQSSPELPGIAQSGALPQLPKDPAPVDACGLLTTAEVTELISDHEVRGDPNLGAGSCTWRNGATYSSVSVSIGRSGSAAAGQLPAESVYGPTEPGPDGIRFAPGGVAEFVVDGHACDIQLVSNLAGEAERSTAVRLVGLVRGRV